MLKYKFKKGDKVKLHSLSEFSGDRESIGVVTVSSSNHVDFQGDVWHDFEETDRRFRDEDLVMVQVYPFEHYTYPEEIQPNILAIDIPEGAESLGGKFRASNGEEYRVSINKIPSTPPNQLINLYGGSDDE